MSIDSTTFDESLVYSNPVRRLPEVQQDGHVHAIERPGVGWEFDLATAPSAAFVAER